MRLEETEHEVVVPPSGQARAAVVWLHGLGADGHDFVPLVSELDLPQNHGIRFVFPHAPIRPVTINGGMRMRAWYDIPSLTNMRQQDEPGIRAAEGIVRRYLQNEIDAGIPAERIVLAGFSQGGAVTLHSGLRYPQRLAGLLALSTYLPLAERFEPEARPERRDTPILMCHGRQDPVLPMAMGELSRDVLQKAGYDVSWHAYPMQHQVCMEEIELVGNWLRGCLSL